MNFRIPLSPVSEAESDTTQTTSTTAHTRSSTTSSSASDSPIMPRAALNFSRPRPVDFSPQHKVHYDRNDLSSSGSGSTTAATVHMLSAFHHPIHALPDEPRFSPDSDLSTSTSSSAHRGDYPDSYFSTIQPRRRPIEYDAQRASTSQGSASTPATLQATPVELPGSEPPLRAPASIEQTHRPSADAQSSAPSESVDLDGEDTRSHHTVSELGDDWDADARDEAWKSSEYDTSGLSEAEIKKLERKGINPALYAEMKAARKGKGKWVSPLVGNTYLS